MGAAHPGTTAPCQWCPGEPHDPERRQLPPPHPPPPPHDEPPPHEDPPPQDELLLHEELPPQEWWWPDDPDEHEDPLLAAPPDPAHQLALLRREPRAPLFFVNDARRRPAAPARAAPIAMAKSTAMKTTMMNACITGPPFLSPEPLANPVVPEGRPNGRAWGIPGPAPGQSRVEELQRFGAGWPP
ncbi:hypothetical protein GTW43_16145 [Streptomyces sp. SID5785]|uniref:hypothetical protein n=1 Tax=Streptomyces sp. SID5785 TaxID=2690309 RepID=UPI001361E9B8|nr:hypothetical protein [Streptomyces sp. SID5785]MZD06616.1 hypothetical protein [Streptomyces sp. SID5785]